MLPNLALTTLYRVNLAPTDPQFLPSCINRDDYFKQTGKQAKGDDPTRPYQYFWSKAAAKLPPNKMVTVLIYNGSATEPALSEIQMRAGDLAQPNLPGDETFPLYTVPVTGAMWKQDPNQVEPNTFPSSWLSKKEYADALAAMFPSSQLETGQECYPKAVFTLNNTPPEWQPWVIVYANGVKDFCGGKILEMYGPNNVNGGGVGSPGEWVNDANTHNGWVPGPHPPGQSVSTLNSPCTPVPDGYELKGVQNGFTFIPMLVPIVAPPTGKLVAKLIISEPAEVAGTYDLVLEGAPVAGLKAQLPSGDLCPQCGRPRAQANLGGVATEKDTNHCAGCGTQF